MLATVTLPERPGAESASASPPQPFALVSAKVTNRDDLALAIEGDTVVLPAAAAGTVEVATGWRRDGGAE